MKLIDKLEANRRLFLKYLTASPLVGLASQEALADELARVPVRVPVRVPDPISWGLLSENELIKSPEEGLSVFDFELVARQNVPAAHFGKMATGSDDEFPLRANRTDFGRVGLRPRRLRDSS